MVMLLLTTNFIFPSFVFSASNTETGLKAIKSFAKVIKKEKGWVLSGSGGSFYNPENVVLNLTFSVCGRYSLMESRKLVIFTAEQFIKHINNEKKYLKIFKNNKFDESNIKLSIDFFDCGKNQSDDSTQVAFVFLAKKKISYFYKPDPQKSYVSNDEEDETYEQARAIVMQEEKSKENE